MLRHAAGAVAEVARELGRHMVPYVPKLLPILLRELRCDSSDNRRNAAFAAGTLAAAAPEACSPHMLNMLQVRIAALCLASHRWPMQRAVLSCAQGIWCLRAPASAGSSEACAST